MKIKVTIGLPCYNAAETVALAIRSILSQSFQDWELLAVDDGSTDGTLAVLREFRDPRIRVLADGRNQGRWARLNQIAAAATGEYLARMDADDLMFPERLARQVAFLAAHPEVDLVGGGVVSIDARHRVRGVRLAPARPRGARRILAGEVLYHPTVLGRTAWFRANPYEDYSYSDDFALWSKAAANLAVANLREPVLFYREHELFTFEKFQGRVRDMRRALRCYGPPAVGRAATAALMLRRELKNSVYFMLYYLGLWKLTSRLSNRSLDSTQVREYQKLLERLVADER